MENVLNSVNVFVGRTYKDKADEVEPRPNGESGMVGSWAKENCDIVKTFFKENSSHFSLIKEWVRSPFWHIEAEKDNVIIEIDGDIGFCIYVYIYGSKYSLWQYDRSVNDKIDTSKENLIYQLNVLKRFLNEVGY
jgi:hypothetical protein